MALKIKPALSRIFIGEQVEKNILAGIFIALVTVLSSCGGSDGVLPTRPAAESPAGTQETANNGDETQFDESGQPEAAPDGRQKLTVGGYMFGGSLIYYRYFREDLDFERLFAKRNPDVDLEFIDYTDWNGKRGDIDAALAGADNYKTRMVTMLMSGTAPDLINLWLLRADKVLDGGFALDLFPFIDADDNISTGDFYPNIIEAFTYNGKLFTLPSAISPQFILVNKDYQDIVKKEMGDEVTITYLDMIRCYEAVIASGVSRDELFICNAWDNSYGYWNVTLMEGPRFLDAKGGAVNFGADFIAVMKDIEPYLVTDDQLIVGSVADYQSGWEYWPENTLFTYNLHPSLTFLIDEIGVNVPFSLPFGIESTTGHVSMTHPLKMFVINSQSTLKDEAWDFVKHMHFHNQSADDRSMPTNREKLTETITHWAKQNAAWIAADAVGGVSVVNESIYRRLREDPNNVETEMGLLILINGQKTMYMSEEMYDDFIRGMWDQISGPIDEFIIRMEKILKSVNYWSLDDYNHEMYNDYRKLSEGLITVEQLAETLSEKYRLYLAQ